MRAGAENARFVPGRASARDHHPRELSMATAAETLRYSSASLSWIRDLLKEELAPYPGRTGVVGRMVVSATLIMIVCMTFRIPYAFQAAIFALLLSRESPRATLSSATKTLIGISVSSAYVLLTVRLVINITSLHFLWIIGSFFIAFYILSAVPDYTTATTFTIVISVAVPLWIVTSAPKPMWRIRCGSLLVPSSGLRLLPLWN